MKIIADANIPFVKEYFSPYGELILKPGRTISSADVIDADILLVRSITHVNQSLLENSTVKFVGSVTAGADHLDTKWLDEARILWNVATGFNAPPVCDYVVSVIACLQKYNILPLQRPKAAIIGVGNVGSLVVERLKSLGFELVLSDPIRAQSEPEFNSVPMAALENLDLISLHVPLTRNGLYPTHHFINREFLAKQKPGTVLLNASRGSVIDSEDLSEYGEHLHWCLDVWEHEPKINKFLLERALIATPHIAGYSIQSKIRGIDMIYKIACERGVIKAQSMNPLTMPTQELRFAGENQNWRDIVLGIFNPTLITKMMRTILIPAIDVGPLFDEMRNQFNYRYEFGFTKIDAVSADQPLLEKLGIKVI